MKNVIVLGSGCSNCKTTQKPIEEVAAAEGILIELEKVEDLQQIMSFGVMSTPGVVIDGQVVHSGGIPSKEAIAEWLSNNTNTGGCDSAGSTGGCCG